MYLKENSFMISWFHTYIYIIGHYNPSAWSLSILTRFMSNTNDSFLKSFSWQFYFISWVFAKGLLSVSHRRNICSYFCFDVWPRIWTRANKPGLIRPHTAYYTKTTSFLIYIHSNIIGHYNPSVKIIGLVSDTTYAVCVNFYTCSAGLTV